MHDWTVDTGGRRYKGGHGKTGDLILSVNVQSRSVHPSHPV